MALVSMRELLDHAAANGYGIPAFNVNNLEQVQAVMEAMMTMVKLDVAALEKAYDEA